MRDYKQTVRELRDPHFVYHFSRDYLKNMMDDAADAIEELCELVDNKTAVKHGRWIQNDNGTYSCNLCQSWIPKEQHYYARFCLYCGAKMKAEEGEDHEQN